MNLDLSATPFSRFGSHLAISHLGMPALQGTPLPGLYLRSVRGDVSYPGIIVCLMPTYSDRPVPYAIEADATLLRLKTAHGDLEIYFADTQVIRIRASGVGLRLTAEGNGWFDHVIPQAGGRWLFNSFSSLCKLMLVPITAALRVDAPWEIDRCTRFQADFLPLDSEDSFEAGLEVFERNWTPHHYTDSFDAGLHALREAYARWREPFYAPDVPQQAYPAGRELASYVLWSSAVNPSGLFRRPAILMSKNWMANVWSWDHCFTALALAAAHPELAWAQFMLPFDQQDESGMLPDLINDSGSQWAFVKPPIHGWALSRLLRTPALNTPEHWHAIYTPLCRWTDWWFTHRDENGDGIPEYHHGNDSGWDNSTVFEHGCPVESPDLIAFLILQLEMLGELARRLGKPDEAYRREAMARQLTVALIPLFWRGTRFSAWRRFPQSDDCAEINSDSLLLYLPLLLGTRLPDKLREALIVGLKDISRLTPHGLATEPVTSSLYRADGYWRGPIWGSVTYLLVDALAACGETEFADDLSRRFCAMADWAGMAENFDAITGEPLRDRAYAWTASVFLLLADRLKFSTHTSLQGS